MARHSKKEVVIRATLSDEATARLKKIVSSFRSITKPIDDVNSKFKQMCFILDPIIKKVERISKSFNKLGKFGLLSVTTPLAGLGMKGIQESANSELELNKLKVVASLDEDSTKILKIKADTIGAATQFSTKDALEGMKYLAMNGIEGFKNIESAITPTMNLTGAAQLKSDIGLSDVAQIMTAALNSFQMNSDQSSIVSDKLAFAMQKSALTMSELGESFIKAAPLSHQAGVNFDELVSALMMLSKFGIKGEVAGTAISGMISRVLTPTKEHLTILQKYDIDRSKFLTKDGKIKSLQSFFEVLEKKKVKIGEIMDIQGQEAGKYLNSLVGASQAWKELQLKLSQQNGEYLGRAKQLNDAVMSGFWGEWEKLQSAFETLLGKLGESGLLKEATESVAKLGAVLDNIGKLEPQEFEKLVTICKILATLPIIALAVGPILTALTSLVGLLSVAVGVPIAAGVGAVTTVAAVGAGAYAFGDLFKKIFFDDKGDLINKINQSKSTPSQKEQLVIDFKNIPRGVEIKPGNSLSKSNFLLNLQHDNVY